MRTGAGDGDPGGASDTEGDRLLWARVVEGDEQAFGDVFTRYADVVYGHCFRRTADWSASEDLTSLVFLHAWRRRHRDRPEVLLPWLLGVANNLLRNHARTLRRQHRLVERLSVPDSLGDVVLDHGDQVAQQLDQTRQMRAVLVALGRMSRGTREVLELVAWDGLTYEQAASALGIPVGTVRSRMSRARIRLQALVDPGVGQLTAPFTGPVNPPYPGVAQGPTQLPGSQPVTSR